MSVLPTGTISLADIRTRVQSGVGQINMSDDLPRKISGVNRTWNSQWSLIQSRGKGWILSLSNTSLGGITNLGFVSSSVRTANINPTSGGHPATLQYTFEIWLESYQGQNGYKYYYKNITITDRGGGFTGNQTITVPIIVAPRVPSPTTLITDTLILYP